MTELEADLFRDEGLRLKPYKDTVGKLTIGVGRNLDDVGISREEALQMLQNDIKRTEADLDKHLSWWRSKPEPIQRVLTNMAFNMGIGGLLKFKNTLKAFEQNRWKDAAAGMLNSKWATQVGDRSKRLAKIVAEVV